MTHGAARWASLGLGLTLAAVAQAELIMSGDAAAPPPALYRQGYAPLPPQASSGAAPALRRSPDAVFYPVYPLFGWPYYVSPSDPRSPAGVNAYALQRAHRFSQNRYDDDRRSMSPLFYPFGFGWMLSYPTTLAYPYPAPGVNAPSHPDNRDMTRYQLERAHRFSRDGYRSK